MSLSFFIIISLINLILSISLKNENNSIINYNIEPNEYNPIKSLIEVADSSDIDEDDWKNTLIFVINTVKKNPDKFYKILIDLKDTIIMMTNNSEALSYIVKDLYNESNPLLNDTFDLIKKNDSDSKNILDYFLVILTNNTLDYLALNKIINFPGFRYYIIKVYSRYKKYFFDIIELLPKEEEDGKKTFAHLICELKTTLAKYQDPLFELFLNLISHYGNRKDMIYDLRDFTIDNRTNISFLEDLRLILNNETLVKEIIEIINLDDKVTDILLKKLIADVDLINLSLDLFKDKSYYERFIEIIVNLKNTDYLNANVGGFMKTTIQHNPKAKRIMLNTFQNTFRNIITENFVKIFIRAGLAKIIGKLIAANYGRFNVSNGCANLFNFTYFNPPKNVSEKFKFYYTKKLLVDSTKSKNDFLTYENCLSGYNKTEFSSKYQIKPIFVVGKIIDPDNQNKLKHSIYFEKYNYMLSFCFPQGIDTSTNEYLCSEKDYGSLILIFNTFASEVTNSTINSIKVFNITDEDFKGKPKNYFYFSLIIIISAIPLLIWIFLIIYKHIKLMSQIKKK